jgi:hypothetical protein
MAKAASSETKTEYRIVRTYDIMSAWALQFKHADGTWRYIHNEYVSLIKEPCTQDNCPKERNGWTFTIESDSKLLLKWFAWRWPRIEDYMARLREAQRKGLARREREVSLPFVVWEKVL